MSNTHKAHCTLLTALLMPAYALAQTAGPSSRPTADTAASDTLQRTRQLSEVVVSKGMLTARRAAGAENAMLLGRGELFKAACCNLGESFVTNPSVDTNYSDATTGTRQIRLLGLSGTYVQLLTETQPAYRGAALPYQLGYIPGNWMKSIQVSKGNASVKNGYEAMTGQINVEYLKPEDETGADISLYGNTMTRFVADADANMHLGSGNNVGTEVLAHFENNWSHHDGNGDGFQDEPNIRQYNLQNRWYAKAGRYLFHGGLEVINENRAGGQVAGHAHQSDDTPLYRIGIDTEHYGAYMKHAFVTDSRHGGNLALMARVSLHRQDAAYGYRTYGVNQKNANAQLMYETGIGTDHNVSAGLSIDHDYLKQQYNLGYMPERATVSETTPGGYVQYTFNHQNNIIFMAGLRMDHSNIYGTFLTPRFHLKWAPSHIVTLRLSAGKGYRSPRPLAENNYLLASGRQIVVDQPQQEAAWNCGAIASLYVPVAGKTLKINMEYYYTNFTRQLVIDYDSDPAVLHITNLNGRSYSHTMQADASYTVVRGLELTAAYRYNLVKSTYGGQRLWKPLQSRYKALLSASYRSPLELWQIDATFALNGGGRMPRPYTTADGSPSWPTRFGAYGNLTAQVTRHFRHFSVFAGGENLTGYRQKNPIIGASNPWASTFDPTMVYAPITGAMGYVGIRINLGHRL
jgi:hypothetical protein